MTVPRPVALTILLFAIVFSGCVTIERSYPDKRYFVLDLGRSAPVAGPAGNGVLQVASVRVSPRYADRTFVYRRSDSRFEADFYNQFLIAPATLIGEEVRRELSTAGIFHHVVGSASPSAASYTLEPVVNALYGDFRDLGSPQAVIEVEFFLSRPAAPGAGIAFHKSYRRVVPLGERTPEALVHGWNQALEGVLKSLIADLKAASPQLKTAVRIPSAAD